MRRPGNSEQPARRRDARDPAPARQHAVCAACRHQGDEDRQARGRPPRSRRANRSGRCRRRGPAPRRGRRDTQPRAGGSGRPRMRAHSTILIAASAPSAVPVGDRLLQPPARPQPTANQPPRCRAAGGRRGHSRSPPPPRRPAAGSTARIARGERSAADPQTAVRRRRARGARRALPAPARPSGAHRIETALQTASTPRVRRGRACPGSVQGKGAGPTNGQGEHERPDDEAGDEAGLAEVAAREEGQHGRSAQRAGRDEGHGSTHRPSG